MLTHNDIILGAIYIDTLLGTEGVAVSVHRNLHATDSVELAEIVNGRAMSTLVEVPRLMRKGTMIYEGPKHANTDDFEEEGDAHSFKNESEDI